MSLILHRRFVQTYNYVPIQYILLSIPSLCDYQTFFCKIWKLISPPVLINDHLTKQVEVVSSAVYFK